MIRYDRTQYAVTAYCTCGWREIVSSQESAWAVAAEHERWVHPDSTQVRDAARVRSARAARDSVAGPGCSGTCGSSEDDPAPSDR